MAPRVSLVVRFGALLSAGAFGVHQLRYLLAYGEGAGGALHATGHGYLTVVEPLLGVLLAFMVGRVVAAAAAGGWRPARRTAAVRLSRAGLAGCLTAGLLAVYTGQELVEGALDPGHPSGLSGVFGHGGWLAVPLSLVVGALLALTVRVVERVADPVRFRGLVAVPAPPCAPLAGRAALPGARHRLAPLAARLAGRAPPALLAIR